MLRKLPKNQAMQKSHTLKTLFSNSVKRPHFASNKLAFHTCSIKTGNTALHDAIIQGKSPEEIRTVVKNQFQGPSIHITLQRNNKLQMATDVLEECRHLYSPAQFSDLSFSFDTTAILFSEACTKKQEINSDNEALTFNLQLANRINQSIQAEKIKSTTHPAANHYSFNEFRAIDTAIHVGRKNSDPAMQSSLLQMLNKYELNFTQSVFIFHEAEKVTKLNRGLEFLQLMTDFTRKTKVGNCTELAVLAMDQCIGLTNGKLSCDFANIENGDHCILVIDPEKIHAAVVLDPWSDEFYPAYKIASQLPDVCYQYSYFLDKEANYLTNFLSSVQSLKPYISYRVELKDTSELAHIARNYATLFRPTSKEIIKCVPEALLRATP
ncbi:MAG: hypothetical protein A3F14_03230 [Gammaproteobacteria bacterium RIFCSPHIGHO2_12_FULL_43_28]|nr:MAG: hypothetical protein A3F14_03230 [Gammaproteobacteria bacterium RIFCSPHIGHO2_12_FULL_43_28]